jgi:hypothetical protein
VESVTAPVQVPENAPGNSTPVPNSGKRSSFRDIRRQLSEEELRQTGVQKLIIEDFERAEADCEALRTYVELYHDKDKEAATLSEKLKTNLALEIVTAAMLAAGGGIVSLASYSRTRRIRASSSLPWGSDSCS